MPDDGLKGIPNGKCYRQTIDPTPLSATELDQAYTCAKLSDAYGDFLGRLGGGTRSRLIPLRAKGTFDRIVINWGVRANGITGLPPERANTAMRELLPVDWPTNAPAVLTAHLIQTGPTYNLESFNESNGAQTNRGSLLLIPVRSGGSSMSVTSPLAASRLAEANNKSEPNLPIGVNCSVPSEINTADSGDAYLANYWACSATFGVPTVIGGGTRNSGTSFLRIEDVYGKTMTDFQVLLYNGSTFVGFAGVQTVVDVTGRAGDRFRRVEGRIEVVDSGFAYPEFTAELAGDGSEPNFCKDYIVTINPWVGDGMENDGNCP